MGSRKRLAGLCGRRQVKRIRSNEVCVQTFWLQFDVVQTSSSNFRVEGWICTSLILNKTISKGQVGCLAQSGGIDKSAMSQQRDRVFNRDQVRATRGNFLSFGATHCLSQSSCNRPDQERTTKRLLTSEKNNFMSRSPNSVFFHCVFTQFEIDRIDTIQTVKDHTIP